MADEDAVVALYEKFRQLGARNPESWAGSEVREDIAQLARFCFLRGLWPGMIDAWRDHLLWVDELAAHAKRPDQGSFSADAAAALARLRQSGADSADLGEVARHVAATVIFDLLVRIDEEYDHSLPEGMPGWRLVELASDYTVTGRDLGGLHESLHEVAPDS